MAPPVPIMFRLAEQRAARGMPLGVGPSIAGFIPLPATYLRIFGVTKDSGGAALDTCMVKLYRTADDALVDSTVSDASGNYEFRTAGLSKSYYVVAYKAGSPDVAGTTINTLIGS